jgi:hypothetical protein
MWDACRLLWSLLIGLFRSRVQANNEFDLGHLLHWQVLPGNSIRPMQLRGSDRALLVWMTRLWPSLLDKIPVVISPQSPWQNP